jgi:N-hydroxyarylamine O-acetyltransferase
MELKTGLDLEAYLARIEYKGDRRPTADTLRELHRFHATHVPFENLDILLGKTINLDLADLEAKIVHGRRGGYCFEQNALFAAALEKLGFAVTRLAARVRLGASRVTPRTHMVLMVEADGQPWLVDVGFGGWGLIEPIPLRENAETRQGAWTFRLRREAQEWILSCLECPVSADQYAFTLEPQLPVDYEPANHFCSTHPQSRFVQTLTAQLTSENVRYILRGNELTTATAAGVRVEMVEGEGALLDLLRERFGLLFPPGTQFGLKRIPGPRESGMGFQPMSHRQDADATPS